MADKTLLGGVTNTTLHRESDGTLIVEEKQDCQGILDHNQRARDHRFSARSPGGDFQEVANIPMVPYLDKCREIGQQPFAAPDIAMELLLRDPQYAKFLSAPKVRDPRVIIKGAR